MKKILIFMFILLFTVFLGSCEESNTPTSKPNEGVTEPGGDKTENDDKTIIHGVTFENKKVTYNGEQHSIYVTDELPEEVSVEYTNNGQVNAGTYTITATLTSNSSNVVIEQSVYTAILTIDKKKIQDVVTFEDYTVEYNEYPNYIYATNIPDGVEVNYINNGQTEVGTYNVEAEFIDSTGNYDCSENSTAILNVTKSSKLRSIIFYDYYGEVLKNIEIMEGNYITSDLIPVINYEKGYEYSWDYDFHTKVATDLEIHLQKVPNEYKISYYHNDSFEDEEFKIKEETVKYNQSYELYTHEYDEFTYAYKYKVYHKNAKNEHVELLDENNQHIIIDGSLDNVYNYFEDIYLVALKDTRNLKFEYKLDNENNTAKVTSFYAEEVTIPKAIYISGEEYIIDEIKEGASESNGLLTTLLFTKDSELKHIGNRAFKWSELSSIELPNSIESIGEEAFYGSKISEISILENINGNDITYGQNSFAYCDNLISISIPKWENQDIYYLFDSIQLENLTISVDNLIMTEESSQGFFGGYLNTLKVNNGFIDFGFTNILSLENLYIGNEVFFFAEVPNVNNVYVQKSINDWIYMSFTSVNLNPAYHSNYFYVYENDEYVLCPSEISVNISPHKGALSGIKQITKIIFEEGITEITAFSCSEIPNLKEVVIPSTVKTINDFAFDSSELLEKVEFNTNSTLEKIGNRAFGYTSLKEIILPASLKYIDGLAFAETNLTEVYIPKSVESIGRGAFYLIDSLKTITFENNSSLNQLGAQAFFSSVETIYFGMTKEEWLNIEMDDEWNEGLFITHAIPNCYLLDENDEYYLANDIIVSTE